MLSVFLILLGFGAVVAFLAGLRRLRGGTTAGSRTSGGSDGGWVPFTAAAGSAVHHPPQSSHDPAHHHHDGCVCGHDHGADTNGTAPDSAGGEAFDAGGCDSGGGGGSSD